MTTRDRFLLVLAGAAVALGAQCSRSGPETGGARFDGTLAKGLVDRQVAFGPRVPGTPAHAQALAWMTDFLRQRADTVEERPFTWVTTRGDTLRLTNVLARFRPAATSRILLLTHWDSRPVAERSADPLDRGKPLPGANDGGSGTAVLMGLADVLSRTPPGVGVDLLFTDGEDWGHDPLTHATEIQDMLLGARQFARTEGATYRPLFGILLDMVGDQDPRFPMEGYSMEYAPEVVRRVWDVARELGYGDVFVPAPGQTITDDHVPLDQAGIRTIDVIDFDYPYWHTIQDTPDKISSRTLGIVGSVMLEVILRQGGGA